MSQILFINKIVLKAVCLKNKMMYFTKYLVTRSTSNIFLKIHPLHRYIKSDVTLNSRKVGMPGTNLPFRKSMDNPIRFTIFYLLAGVIGFGAPWLVIMHQMLRPYDYVVDE